MTSRKRTTTHRNKWLRENAQAIAEYNALVAKLGTFAFPRTRRPRSGTLADFFDSSPLRGSRLKVYRSKDQLRSK
jgi:hypothetical protein